MNKKIKIAFFILLSIGAVLLPLLLLQGSSVPVLQPKGSIAEQQRDLIVFATLLSLIIILPVFFLTFYIAWKYRAGNKKAKYTPETDGNKVLESIWWAIPCLIILVLAVVTWRTSHELDPFRPIEANAKPLTVQVVALQWKWLFIYPEQNIATVNLVQFPEDTPVNFEITADAPMNSFWIPSLGGQVYAMSAMTTKLHLMANEPGSYTGSSANLSGERFAEMNFTAKSTSKTDFDQWVNWVKQTPVNLNSNAYSKLAEPGVNKEPIYYSSAEKDLHRSIVMKFMTPGRQQQTQDPKDLHHNQEAGQH